MSAKILFTVSCLEPRTHYLKCEMRILEVGQGPVELAMPVWTPGAYAVHDFAGRVHGVDFTDGSSAKLKWEKIDKTTWRVRPSRSGCVICRYSIFALEIDVDKSYLDDRRATINGAGVFMYVVGREQEPHQVTFVIPPTWKRIDTGLVALPRPARTYRASSYDELVDCPVMLGNQRVESFTVRGVPHRLVIVGPGNYDVGQLVRDTGKIVEQAITVFDDVPYSHYTFFMEMAPEGRGGLEHKNSTHMIFPAWGFRPRKDYILALGLISHEFFHTWNVKRLRPHPLGPFDYSKEVYTPLLWFAEGFTSYYDSLLLRRGGCITAREYLDEIGHEVRRLNASPGRLVQSLEESSMDTWIKLYRPTPDSPNTTISYYNKGALFGMALDLSIREATGGRRKLDDVMRLLYQRYYKQRDEGLLPEHIEAACEEVVGKSQRPLFDLVVRSTREIDWGRWLKLTGLEIASKQKPKPASQLKPGDETTRSFLGVRLKSEGRTTVTQVLAGSPAHRAGLCAGDELIALDANRLDEARLDKWLGEHPAGHRVRFTICRTGVLREMDVTLGTRPLLEFSIQPLARASVRQKKLCQGWLDERWAKIDRPKGGLDLRPREKVY
ncbi:MAG: M61 family metallopeptidase [Candidatus Riflebacteria bacterium]|nr:M61 family metallopeptidase [Candidatus Riflebacteria bacterium]